MIKVIIKDIKDPIISRIYEHDIKLIEELRRSKDPDIENKALELGYQLGTYLKEITDNGFVEIEIPEKLVMTGRFALIDQE